MRRALLSTIPLIAGLLMVIWGVIQLDRAYQTQSWPVITGTIVTSQAAEDWTTQNDQTFTTYNPVISYTYEVDGKNYRSSRIRMAPEQLLSREDAEDWLAQYPEGLAVNVYYDPRDPGQAVLHRESYVPGTSYLIAGLFLVIIALASSAMGIVASFRRRFGKGDEVFNL